MTAALTLDAKLKRITDGTYGAADFIIADAKDGDMGLGLGAPGPNRDATGRIQPGFKPKESYLTAMEAMTRSGLVDIMLMSLSSAEELMERGVFSRSDVTPAVRLNDTTDIWSARGSSYRRFPSVPFATADLAKVRTLTDLGLYSVTFSNDVYNDLDSLNAYRAFREEAEKQGLRHFLEVFNPAFDINLDDGAELGFYINDMILKAIAGLARSEAPLFLKMQFNGPAAMEELASYDPSRLVVGILGGSKGTTRDTFELVYQAAKYGARVALFGRKINLAEHPIEIVKHMRAVVEGDLSPEEAVQSYHSELNQAGLNPERPMDDDLQITDPILQV